jgi:glycosyltransferase involved in cell wall biosynthesis
MRLAVYTDYAYRQEAGVTYGERAFVVFVCRLGEEVEQLTVLGRLNPQPGRSHYRLPDDVRFVGLPHYETLTRPHEAVIAMVRSLRRFWTTLDDVDGVWLLGPYIHSIAFVWLARLRRVPIVLGVRQDLPAYTRNRHPRKRVLHWAADALEATWRRFARRIPIVVVGPDLAERYAAGCAVLPIAVSLVREDEIADAGEAAARSWDDEIRILSVGRIDREKNPLLLADILAELRRDDPRWRLEACGDGPLREPLRERLAELGMGDAAELPGYIPVDEGLGERYRSAHVLLHVSWTEGLPQVLFEAFAAGLPVVATAVGGVPAAAGDAALLIGPGDAPAAADALRRLASDPALRTRMVEAGVAQARGHTLEGEVRRVAAFLREELQPRRARRRRPAW